MNTEEKAKAYDEALERARIYRDNAKVVEDYAAVARYENIFPELREEEKPLTPFQQCLNFVLRKVHFASIPGKIENTDKFILDTVKRHTDELVELAKKHEYTDCQLRESEDAKMIQEFNDWLCEEIECRTSSLCDEKDRRTLNMLCYVLTKVKEWLGNRYQYVGVLIDSLQQEQPKVDLEKEYKEYVEDDPVFSRLTNRNVGLAIARHFFNLGLNVRKEE